jgi:AcrR family transcriptional regulator
MSADPCQARGRRRRAVRRDALSNREKILSAAAHLMAERGRNVPLADIAEAAGVGVGTLYRGWPDRTALLHTLEHRAYEQLITLLAHIEDSGETGAEAIDTYLHGCLVVLC